MASGWSVRGISLLSDPINVSVRTDGWFYASGGCDHAAGAQPVHDEWDRRTRAHDIDGLLQLCLPEDLSASIAGRFLFGDGARLGASAAREDSPSRPAMRS